MSLERYSRTIPASGVIESGPGNILLLLTATLAVSVRLERGGNSEGLNNITGGIVLGRVVPWENVRILGTAGTTVDYYVGQQNVDQDVTDVRLQIATISGIASVAVAPSSTIAETVDAALASGANTAIAANLTRRRITFGVPSDALNSIRISTVNAADRGIEIQPGTQRTFETTAALNVRNNDDFGTAAGTVWYSFEES